MIGEGLQCPTFEAIILSFFERLNDEFCRNVDKATALDTVLNTYRTIYQQHVWLHCGKSGQTLDVFSTICQLHGADLLATSTEVVQGWEICLTEEHVIQKRHSKYSLILQDLKALGLAGPIACEFLFRLVSFLPSLRDDPSTVWSKDQEEHMKKELQKVFNDFIKRFSPSTINSSTRVDEGLMRLATGVHVYSSPTSMARKINQGSYTKLRPEQNINWREQQKFDMAKDGESKSSICIQCWVNEQRVFRLQKTVQDIKNQLECSSTTEWSYDELSEDEL